MGQAVALPLALLVLAGQHHFESRRKHAEQRAVAYSDYLTAMTEDSAPGLTEEEAKRRTQRVVAARYRICVYGSARVLRTMVEGTFTPDRFDNFESQRALALMVEAMRKDVGAMGSDIADIHILLFPRNAQVTPLDP